MVAGQSVRRFDVMRELTQAVANVIKRKPQLLTPPTDGNVLKLHYKFTFWLVMTGFAAIWYSWLQRDLIVCVYHFNADLAMRLDHLNLCLSYPYIVLEDGSRQHLLFYRWVHWTLLLVSFAYYIPHKISKMVMNAKLPTLLTYLEEGRHRYDGHETNMCNAVAKYFAINMRGHNTMFYNYLAANISALFVNLFVFFSLDELLLNKYAGLGYQAFPYSRDNQYFSDPLSVAFPPFASCEITDTHKLINNRVEKIGCHLTAMEFYEKLFMMLWFWQIALMIITTLYITYLCLFFIPSARAWIIRCTRYDVNEDGFTDLLNSAGKRFLIGDWFLLYKLNVPFSCVGYAKLVKTLNDADYMRSHVDVIRRQLMLMSRDDINYGRNLNKNRMLVE